MSDSEELDLESSIFMKEDDESEGEDGDDKNDHKEGTSADSEEGSDIELQVAFRGGLLQKHWLVVPQLKKREPIYKKEEMERKFVHFHRKRNWLDTLHVSFSPNLCYSGPVSKDFERESAFYKQALDAAKTALARLETLKVPVHRPADYFAEMAKSDNQMDRVRRKLLDVQKVKERREHARRLREERKFAVKVQKSKEERKRKEKRKLIEATKKHRKGMKGQLEEMLKNAKRMQVDEEDEKETKGGMRRKKRPNMRGGKMSRRARDKKFGFGGQKKRSKRNDRKSFDMH